MDRKKSLYENDAMVLEKLRKMAQIASVYHGKRKFQRNSNLSHVVHASLHFFQSVLVQCFVSAALMLILGIVEMKHADIYLDLALITDQELLKHPIFIHNFTMCLMSIFCMAIYLLHGWILFDYYVSVQIDTNEDLEYQKEDKKQKRKEKEEPGELDPIATFETFTSFSVSEKLSVQQEPVIFYCCFVDCYNYLKHKREMEYPLHEFQVIHVM
ncbi:hypothetical protein WH47_05328 [Habropoda laboriosa]|uniref:DUF7775 domain-containing protein n=1 Tax=Habropoda laboriosa TaxID=597456 RepID=A0A0L7QUQ8_9HYME|nr:hypothetical protein WH47_05328 [Habropoda laboriosa]